jgi:serine/threonine protein kinase/predicted negative regulator of RcsB-dependent stress response
MKDHASDGTLYCFRFGAAQFDEARLELLVDGRAADLEKKPLHLLAELLRHVNEVVTRDELFDLVWGGRRTIDHVLTNAMAKLRKALGPQESRIVTVPRVSYRFTGPVERVAVGRRFSSQFEFRMGVAVPGREHFVLESQLSASPHGEVWLARHAKTKELRIFKFGTEGERLAALKREATLYRVLREGLGERPDIAKIIDWNFDTPPFYLECEYGGETLSHWASTHTDLSTYTQSQRVALFLAIVQAVDAAHSVGVLHKDLKPDNILIARRSDGGWQIRVVDFGSGRLLQPDRLAALGITQTLMTSPHDGDDSLSGTALYLAPELIQGKPPTVQSDVYALGMILYQLLVGDLSRPLASGWEEDIEDPLLRDDIAAATRGNPAKRLRSAAELVERLRGLHERRVERDSLATIERRAELAERQLMQARTRRPWVVLAAVLVALGVGLGAWQLRDERVLRRRAEHVAVRAEAINRFLADDLLGAADPSGPGGTHNPQIREVLARAAARLENRFLDDPETKASIDLAMGNAYFGLSDYANADLYRRRAVDLLSRARGAADAETLKAEYQLAAVLVMEGKFDPAAQLLDSADGRAGERLTGNSQLSFQAHWSRAALYRLRNDAARSLTEYQTVYRVQQAIDPTNATLMFRARDGISWSYLRLGQSAAAEQILRDLMVPTYTPQWVGPLTWAQARLEYAAALLDSKNYAAAEKFARAAVTEIRDALGSDHYFTGVSLNQLGEVYSEQGRWDQAVDAYKQAREVMRQRVGDTGQGTLIAAANVGIVEYRTGQYAEAIKELTPLHDTLVKELGAPSPQAQSVAFYLASSLSVVGQPAPAAQLTEQLDPVALAAAEPRNDWPERLQALHGEILLAQGRLDQAVAALAPAYEHMRLANAPAGDLDHLRAALDRARRGTEKPLGRVKPD